MFSRTLVSLPGTELDHYLSALLQQTIKLALKDNVSKEIEVGNESLINKLISIRKHDVI